MNAASGTDKPSEIELTRIVPRATYRLQLRREFNFQNARSVLPYLAALGISHLYLSPIFRARRGSASGYDVVDHRTLNPDLGSMEDFRRLALDARSHGLGIILDIVPNHMAVATDENEWWLDVLENGPASRYADYFDIDWTPIRKTMRNRLLLPILENRYGDELHAGRLRVEFDRQRGSLQVRYFDHRIPLDPQQYPLVLSGITKSSVDEADEQDFLNIVEHFGHLPTRCDAAPEQIERRHRDKEVLKRRLARLCERNVGVCGRIDSAVTELNGRSENPESLDALASLLNAQPFRLAYWKVAGDEINYRRFFDVNQLAALRVENPDVFAATHELVFELLREGYIDGLRVDHIDGLHTPSQYLDRLRTLTREVSKRECYIVVEKILAAHERLRDDWPVEGTTGYEFNASMTGWLTSDKHLTHLDWTYRQFIRTIPDYAALVYDCKKLLMRTSLAAEISVLTTQLDRIAQAHRDTTDFTHLALRDALTEVIAAFPVYRTYVDRCKAEGDDIQSISWAVGTARSHAKGSDRSIFDFIEAVLLCHEHVASTTERRHAILEFTRKFQQVTAPVTAKSVEDTAFYRYCRLLAVNEVGGDPRSIGISTAALHRSVMDRQKRWPHCMISTSTHDSKRGEDTRFRLCALTELPKQWRAFATKLSRLNRGSRGDWHGNPAPTLNDEYLLLQSLVGIWPTQPSFDFAELIERIKNYAIKAVREGKDQSSWIDPDQGYEAALLEFIDGFGKKPRRERLEELVGEFVKPLAFFGVLNSVAAVVCKLTMPGVPDFYQGSEFVELTLVDPDNRRLVDFESRAVLSERLAEPHSDPAKFVTDLLAGRRYDDLKLWIIRRLLEVRRESVELFAHGDYFPLEVQGERADHVCAFLRNFKSESLLIIATRWSATLTQGREEAPIGEAIWGNTSFRLPDELGGATAIDLLFGNGAATGSRLETETPVAQVFKSLPVAIYRLTSSRNR